MSKTVIYADHAATTPLSPTALVAMRPFLESEYGNPSTLYSLARYPRKAIADSRKKIANVIGSKEGEIFFTSGGTEADNWALLGTALRYPGQRKRIITSCIEHHAVLNTCEFLNILGYEIVYLPVDHRGLISGVDLADAINNETILVSIMFANNEIGTVEPIEELCKIAHSKGVLFHTDAVQAVGHQQINVEQLGIDLLSASAHKFYGPKGTGFLYVKDGTPIEPLLHGGGQENRMRSGTENVAGIVGMSAALAETTNTLSQDIVYLEGLRNRLICSLEAKGINFVVNGAEDHVPGSLSISFRDISGEMLIHRLDLMGIAIATGSACDSKNDVVSHVLQAIKIPDEYVNGTVRITLGKENTNEEIDRIVSSVEKIVKQ